MLRPKNLSFTQCFFLLLEQLFKKIIAILHKQRFCDQQLISEFYYCSKFIFILFDMEIALHFF